jgi:dienelactone hydrolase
MVATSEIEYEADGGLVMIGHLAVPDDDAGAALPAVLVAHEAPGLDDVHRQRADGLAQRGYVAFALDAHGGGRFQLDDPRTRERVAAITNDPDRARAIAASALEVLRGHPRVDASRLAAIGYCFGGTLVLELARGGADLRAVVGFHPGLGTSRPEDASNITGRVLVCVGSEDPYVDGDARAAFEAEMRAGGVDWRMHLYGGVQHSFTHPHADRAGIPGLAYNPAAADRAWRAMLDLFEEVIGPEPAPSHP